jgi:hypothetical protein
MTRQSILSIDINNEATNAQRETFYKELEARKWEKVSSLTTIWVATWAVGTTDDAIIRETQSDVEAAASVAKVHKYDAAAVCGSPVVWNK